MVDPEKGYFGASDVRKDLILCLQGQEEKTAMVPHEHDDALERQRNALRIAENLVEQNRKDLREHLQMVAGGTAGLGVAYVGVVYEYYGPLTAMGALVGITWFGMGAGMTLVTGMEYFTRRKLLRHEKEKAEMLLELDPEIRHLKEERIQEYEKLDTWAHLGMKGCTLASTAIGIVAGGAYLWQDNPFMAGLSGATGAAGVAFAEFMRRSATKPVRDNIKRLEEKIAYLSPRGEWVPEPETRDTKPLFCYYPDSFVQQIQRVAERYKDQGIDCRIEGDFNANNSAYELRIHVQCDDNGEGHNVMLERSSEGIPERPRFHFYKDGNTDAISAIFGLPPCGFNLGINEVVNGHHRSPHSVKDGALTEYPVDTGRHMHEEVLGRYARFMRTLEVRAPELLKLLDSRISRNMPATEEYKKEFSWRVSDTWRGRWTFADRLKYEGKETP